MDIREATERLEAAFHKWIDSDDFRKIEKCMRLFHNYSFFNIVLILFQKPDATRVAGFNTWKKLNRYVKKGEKGIAILAPTTRKRTAINDKGDEETITYISGFKATYVFDVSQTEGQELPSVSEIRIKDEYEGFQTIARTVKDMGYEILFYDGESTMKGFTKKGTKAIYVHEEETTGQKSSTIVHEWAHLQLGNELERADEEIVVQTASYFIMASLGFDTSWYTAQYVQNWSRSKKWADVSRLFAISDRLCKKFLQESEAIAA
ncbi:MAG TPA: ArdC family protein [Mesotoga sp.]|nr:ArdC family protein [Mesotoga sp.]